MGFFYIDDMKKTLHVSAGFGRAGCVMFMALCAAAVTQGDGLSLSVNPYEGVDWEKTTQHKANLHTHTVASGGKLFLEQVFAEYAKRGYTILSITDHDLCTRWWKAGIDPLKDYGILPVTGQEYSRGHHVNGFFLDYETAAQDTDLLVREITGRGGVAFLNHPGRYWKMNKEGLVPKETCDEYVKLLDRNSLVLGIEVLNRNEKGLNDILLWDAILRVSMPARPVWGFSNDDMHERKQLGQNWNIFLLDRLDEGALRHAMMKGHFYFSAQKQEHGGTGDPPVIQAIIHDPAAQTLTLSAASDGALLDADRYRWIADGKVIHEGPVLNYGQNKDITRYVRAELTGKSGTTYTNPFGFSRALR